MKCFLCCRILVVALFVASSSPIDLALAEELKTAGEIVDFSVSKMASYKTWSADYTQTLNMPGGPMTISGQIKQKQPQQMWIQLDMPMTNEKGQMTVIMDADGILWQIMRIAQRTQIMKTDMNKVRHELPGTTRDPFASMNPTRQWEVSRELYDLKVTNSMAAEGADVYVLDGQIKTNAMAPALADSAKMGRMRVSIGRKDGFPRRMELYDKSSSNLITSMEFKNVKLDPDISGSMFVYQPSTNNPPTDMTAMFIAQVRGQASPDHPLAAPK